LVFSSTPEYRGSEMDFVVDVLRAVVMLGFVGLAILVLAGLFMIVFSLATSIDKRVSE